jgi:hypothetical protein
MRRLYFVFALAFAGCHNIIGPFEHRPVQRVDDPGLSIAEQEREGRARLPFPIESPRVAPPSGVEGPGLIIRQ